MKQSSIEWLEETINGFVNSMPNGNILAVQKAFNKAKEMHKQEVIDARISKVSFFNESEKQEQRNEAEQYYNETHNIKR